MAPGSLALLQAFINTTDLEDGREELAQPADLARWLHANGLTAAELPISAKELRETLALREALRAFARQNNGIPVDEQTLEILDAAGQAAHSRLRFDASGGVHREPVGQGLQLAWARLLELVADSIADGTWLRFKSCKEDNCQWAFYDRSVNRSSHWCTMATCGSRAKMRKYRARARG